MVKFITFEVITIFTDLQKDWTIWDLLSKFNYSIRKNRPSEAVFRSGMERRCV